MANDHPPAGRSPSRDPRQRPLRVGLQWGWHFEANRQVIMGVLDYAERHTAWEVVWDIRFRPDIVREYHLDALIAMPVRDNQVKRLRQASIPVVTIIGSRARGQLPLVAFDDRAIGKMAAEYFLNLGLKNIAYYSHVRADVDIRGEGFREALARMSITPHQFRLARTPVRADVSLVASDRPIVQWLKSLPSPVGIFAYNDLDAMQLASVVRKAGRHMPDDVALLGVDNDPVLCRLSHCALSSIDHGAAALGRQAALMIDQLLAGQSVPLEPVLIPPVGVIARASTDTLALDDPDVVAALRMIRQRACDRLRCEDVIESTAISRSTLDARFQALIGRTVHQEIFRVRLNKAMQLLRDTDCSLVEVTNRSGFRYPSQLCHLFKKHLGVTPGQFRLNARSAPVPIRAGR